MKAVIPVFCPLQNVLLVQALRPNTLRLSTNYWNYRKRYQHDTANDWMYPEQPRSTMKNGRVRRLLPWEICKCTVLVIRSRIASRSCCTWVKTRDTGRKKLPWLPNETAEEVDHPHPHLQSLRLFHHVTKNLPHFEAICTCTKVECHKSI